MAYAAVQYELHYTERQMSGTYLMEYYLLLINVSESQLLKIYLLSSFIFYANLYAWSAFHCIPKHAF